MNSRNVPHQHHVVSTRCRQVILQEDMLFPAKRPRGLNGRTALVAWWIVAVLVGSLAMLSPEITEAQSVVVGRYGGCGAYALLSSPVGNVRSFCGTYWGSEHEILADGSRANPSSRRPQADPQPMAAAWQAMIQQQEMQGEQEREQWVARMQKLREEQAAKNKQRYERLIGKTEQFRNQDDPEFRAERHLASAIRSENQGELKAAASYYRLILRSLPQTAAADQAATALDRMGLL